VVYTCGLQSMSSLSYAVTVPAVRVINLWPVCVCQPVSTPGVQVLFTTHRYDGPLVFCHHNQTSRLCRSSGVGFVEMKWLKTSNSRSVPCDRVTVEKSGVLPDVACTRVVK
jgi:hypothetical protein